MTTQHLRSILLAAGSAAFAFAFALTSTSTAAAVCPSLKVYTTLESHGPHIPFPGQAYGYRAGDVVSGDFNGDGYGDSVFNETGANIGNEAKAGRVYVVYGSINAAAQVITQASLPGQVNIRESYFGSTIASGDINADGYDDLVVTALHSTVVNGPGKYFVVPGSANGLQAQLATSISGVSIPSNANTVHPIAVADFDRDGFDDVALGQPWWQGTCPQLDPYGRLVVAYGTGATNITFERMTATSQNLNGVQCGGRFAAVVASGIVGDRMRIFAGQPDYDVPNPTPAKDVGGYLQFDATTTLQQVAVEHGAQANSHYGTSFAFGDFDGDGRADYAVSAGGGPAPGWVRIEFARGASQVISRSQFANAPLPFDDRFGYSLAAGDFDGDRMQDLIFSESRYPGSPTVSDDWGAILIARGSYLGNLQPVHSEIQVAPANAASYGSGAMAAIDVDNDGIDEVLVGNHTSELDGEPIVAGFMTRSRFVNLGQCHGG